MIERILKHMNIYREMKNAAIPMNLIGKKGEDSCMNAARLVNQQELSSLMEGLNEETISSLMDDPEILISLGKMNKKDFSILEPDRIRMIVECAGNEKLSEFPYEKIEKVLADKEIPDRIVYVYLKYYAFLEPKEELKKQLVASLDTCIGEFDVARAGIKIRMLLINPAFSTELLYELLKDEESLALLLKQDLMELVNYLSEFCEETESLNKKQLEELSRHPKEIRNGLEVVLAQIPKEWQASFLHLWLWNESLYADIPKLIRFLTGPDADFEKVSNGKAAYVNTLYIDTFGIGIDKEELYNYESTMIIGAGSFPGLSGILPVWIRKEQQESEIRRVNIFAGGNEHITASACADFLLSTFSQFGKIDSYYSHQQIKKTENITERVPLIFPDTAEIMEYLPDEIYLSAEYSRIDELHWYNVQTNSEYRNIIQEALLKLMISQEYEYVNRLAENVKRKLENKREESKTWYRIWLEIETVTEKKNYGYEALDSYKINGRIAAFCAEALCSGICQKGIYWPFEILDAEIVMNSLINEEILIGLKENDKKMQEHDLNYEEGEL